MQEKSNKETRRPFDTTIEDFLPYMTPYQKECLKHPLSREEAIAQIQRNHQLSLQRKMKKQEERNK